MKAMENKKEPLMSAEDYFENLKTPLELFSFAKSYSNYVTQWHLNNAKEFVADEARVIWQQYGMDIYQAIDKQSINTAIDNYIEINLNK